MQVGIAVVDQTVRMTFGAVVALTGFDILIHTIHQNGSSTFEDMYKFAVCGVGMYAD